MLSLEQIKPYYPENLLGFERFMLREYLQYKILDILFESEYSDRFSFIGGTALRIVHGNNRFSEDLDFDNFNLSDKEFGEVSEIIKYGLELEGYQLNLRNVMGVAYHCYIRFPNLLYDNNLSGHSEEKIMIRLDTEAQYINYEPESYLINRFDVFSNIKVTPRDLLLAQKFLTILERKRNKGRDFYDVVFFIGKGVSPDYDFLNQKAGISDGKSLKEALLVKIGTLDMGKMAAEVKPFLMNPGDSKKVELFRNYILQTEL
jgi:predicted nucleotidyltransferase component of viral defense system